jgi:hypothetical protein
MKKLQEKLSNSYWKTQVAVGSALLMVSGASMAAGANVAGADTSAALGDSVDSLSNNIANIPFLLLSGAQIGGIYFGYKAWDNWSKVQKGNDPEAKPAKTAGYTIAAAGAYFLPSILGMGGKTLLPGL